MPHSRLVEPEGDALETLKYSPNKLWLRLAGAAGMLAFAVWLFGNSDIGDDFIFDLTWFGGDIGHYLVLPFTIASSGVVAWLTAMRLMGGCEAVEATPDAVLVTGFWGRTRIAWDALGHVYIVRKRRRFFRRASWLVFHFTGRGLFGSARVRVLLDATDLAPAKYEAYCAAILAAKRGGERGSERVEPDTAGGAFDADAALARYLARKAAGPDEAPLAPPPRPVPARPVFGRRLTGL